MPKHINCKPYWLTINSLWYMSNITYMILHTLNFELLALYMEITTDKQYSTNPYINIIYVINKTYMDRKYENNNIFSFNNNIFSFDDELKEHLTKEFNEKCYKFIKK